MESGTPWEAEPDDFYFSAYGLPVRGHRHDVFGNCCGYCGIPPSHPLYGHDFRDAVPHPPGLMQRDLPIDEYGILNIFMAAFDRDEWGEGYAPVSFILGVHGGLSFAGHMRTDTQNWYFGFDCGHAGDIQPGLIAGRPAPEWYTRHNVYRTMEYVQGECMNLAEQLAGYAKDVSHDAIRQQATHRD